MKKLEDFADDINKCSKCGLCQSVCPVYKITGNDCAVSRGKFVMLDGVLKGDLKLNKNIEKYLDMCLKCGKCRNFCPSGIDVCEIFNTAKYECAKNTFHGKFEKFLESRFVFGNIMKVLSKLHLPSTLKEAAHCRHSEHDHKRSFAHAQDDRCEESLLNNNFNQGNSSLHTSIKLLYFKGCVNNIYPKTEKSLKKIFAKLPNVQLIEKDFDCCGLPFLSSGNMERFEEVKKHNLELMDCEFDYILTDCASCESTIKSYFDPSPEFVNSQNSLTNPTLSFLDYSGCGKSAVSPHQTGSLCSTLPKIRRKWRGKEAFLNAAEFLATQNLKFKFKKSVKVTFHKPCHLENIDFLIPLLAKCENIEYVEMKDFDECCGFAGEFSLKNHKISKKISKKKAQNAYETGADYILTTCPACIMGLHQGFLFSGKKAPKIMNIIDFLAEAVLECE